MNSKQTCLLFLVHEQNLLAKQLNLRIIDSGIGNPNQVRERDKYERKKKRRRRRSEILSDYCAGCCSWLVIAIRRCLAGERRHLTLFFFFFSYISSWDTSCMLHTHYPDEYNNSIGPLKHTHTRARTPGWSINDEWCWTIRNNIEQQEREREKKSFLVSSFVWRGEHARARERGKKLHRVFCSLSRAWWKEVRRDRDVSVFFLFLSFIMHRVD